MKCVESILTLAGVLVLHHVIFSYSGWSSLKTGQESANVSDKEPVEELIFSRLIKNAQMQGARNPKE
jgi:hypothetical protein